tara:strand:+ start:46 stop:420 length:375 start_codon:yes stop_codon:yes gene_type:complete
MLGDALMLGVWAGLRCVCCPAGAEGHFLTNDAASGKAPIAMMDARRTAVECAVRAKLMSEHCKAEQPAQPRPVIAPPKPITVECDLCMATTLEIEGALRGKTMCGRTQVRDDGLAGKHASGDHW